LTIILHNGKASFHISQDGWGKLLELGQRHGWQPAGTEPPQWNDPHIEGAYADQNGIYTSVNDVDARALGAALARALSNLPGPRIQRPAAKVSVADPLPSAGKRGPGSSSPAAKSELSGEDEAQTTEFVAFARQGRFSVLLHPSPKSDRASG
jgi:hypothetical protein